MGIILILNLDIWKMMFLLNMVIVHVCLPDGNSPKSLPIPTQVYEAYAQVDLAWRFLQNQAVSWN